jgi:glycosyltransferase involved in cell wall biosynthesis
VVLDIVDLWPQVLVELLPRVCRSVGRAALAPLYFSARAACREATAIFGPTEPFVDWGLRLGRRNGSEWDRSFAPGYVLTPVSPERQKTAEEFWDQRGVASKSDAFYAVFLGTIGRQFTFEPIFDAARILQQARQPIRFVFAGVGDCVEHYKSRAAGLDNVDFPGWVGMPEILTLMRRSAIGLAPYRTTPNFTMNIPGKIAEYLAGGLPIALSLSHGVMHNLLRDRCCGFSYDGDPRVLADRLGHLCERREDLASLSANARALFDEAFTVEAAYGELTSHLERMVAAGVHERIP